MRLQLFLSRVAFICNILFVLCLLIRHTHINIPLALHEVIIITGWIMSMWLNLAYVLLSLAMRFRGLPNIAPPWINATNTAFLLFQIIYFFFI